MTNGDEEPSDIILFYIPFSQIYPTNHGVFIKKRSYPHCWTWASSHMRLHLLHRPNQISLSVKFNLLHQFNHKLMLPNNYCRLSWQFDKLSNSLAAIRHHQLQLGVLHPEIPKNLMASRQHEGHVAHFLDSMAFCSRYGFTSSGVLKIIDWLHIT